MPFLHFQLLAGGVPCVDEPVALGVIRVDAHEIDRDVVLLVRHRDRAERLTVVGVREPVERYDVAGGGCYSGVTNATS